MYGRSIPQLSLLFLDRFATVLIKLVEAQSAIFGEHIVLIKQFLGMSFFFELFIDVPANEMFNERITNFFGLVIDSKDKGGNQLLMLNLVFKGLTKVLVDLARRRNGL